VAINFQNHNITGNTEEDAAEVKAALEQEYHLTLDQERIRSKLRSMFVIAIS
jgi:hypothetical protein